MGISFLGCMHTAVDLTFWEECFPQPFLAVLGASIIPHSVPPLSLNLSYLSELVSRQGSHGRSAQSHHRCNITAPAVHNGTEYGLPSHGVEAGKQWQRAMRKAPPYLHNCLGQNPCLPLHHLNHHCPYHQGS